MLQMPRGGEEQPNPKHHTIKADTKKKAQKDENQWVCAEPEKSSRGLVGDEISRGRNTNPLIVSNMFGIS